MKLKRSKRADRQSGRGALPILLLIAAGLCWFWAANCGQTIAVNSPPQAQPSLWSRMAHRFHSNHAVTAKTAVQANGLGGAAPAPSQASSITVRGAGSTFAAPLLNVWKSALTRINPDVRIDYSSEGSESGLQKILSGDVDFALTEVPLTSVQLSEARTPLEQFPLTAGPVCVVYNLPELVFPLKLTPQTLADIYLGEITEWNDEQIARDNPNVDLPHTTIITVHRAQASGTTNILTHYLSAVSEQWKEEAGEGSQVKWPALGRSGAGNEGVAQAVTHVAGGIGFVECGFAAQSKLPVARIQNQSGHYIDPTAASVAAAVQSFSAQMARDPFTIPVNSPDPAAYPIVGVSYIVFPQAVMQRRNLQPLLGFLDWALNQGQNMASLVNYAPLPNEVLQKQRKELDRDPAVPLSADLLFGVSPDQDRSAYLPKLKKLPKQPAPADTVPEPRAIGKNG